MWAQQKLFYGHSFQKFAISIVRSRQKLVCSTADLTKSIGEKKLAPGLPGVRSLENLFGWSSPPKNTLFKKPAFRKSNWLFLNKWANPGLFFVYFLSFQTNIITICTKIRCEKCPNRIQCQDLNQQPLECESLPITTIPGLPPITDFFLWGNLSVV